MTLPKRMGVRIGDYVAEYYLSNLYCPKCSNQTLYYLGSQMAAYACVNCHSEFQIRPDTKPSQFNEVLFYEIEQMDDDWKLDEEDDLMPNWGDV